MLVIRKAVRSTKNHCIAYKSEECHKLAQVIWTIDGSDDVIRSAKDRTNVGVSTVEVRPSTAHKFDVFPTENRDTVVEAELHKNL